ncbi:ASCH domain-containing protein [Schleiferilactobacillus perolens]|jgi:ASC-1-like (ASCH) protein|uniref:ASCH domain-containing protein n=1 Tax=Schleiferilactobacillus perolens TaxID=100468 RepID=UPI0023523A78|nr:ASCH domain-containing protein [Schleiferilactobacillus perolens]MCI1890722.1 ASCH domain-containing protein [Schleiferilactobacillus harbinensis]MCI1913235.1 ASCH domain-containing protein [Schleiferilactobacillus harbinensis]MCI2172256.1 ASCH domain-containing protein [Schleiferilactobacillus perolens]
MQQWSMHLNRDQYDLLKAGSKTVEIRLRSQDVDQVQPTDIIHFIPTPAKPSQSDEETLAVVTDINDFDTFEEGLRHFPPAAVGSPAGTSVREMVNAMYTIYSPADEAKHGVVFFTLDVVKPE